jgi:hypothetical protein
MSMSFALLATLELQLIMRFADSNSFLQLARCSHATLVAALEPFAQQGSSMVVQLSDIRAAFPPPLLAHAGLTVLWRSPADFAKSLQRMMQHTHFLAFVLSKEPEFSFPSLHVNQLVHSLGASTSCQSLTMLDFSGQQGSLYEAVLSLATLLPRFPRLTDLRLAQDIVTEKPLKALATAIGQSSTLKVLDLSHNHLFDSGAEAFAQALREPYCGLTELYLRKCSVGQSGAIAMAAALQLNSSLRILDLRTNGIVGTVGEAAMESIRMARPEMQILLHEKDEIRHVSGDTWRSLAEWKKRG